MLLHGWCDDRRTWDPILEQLSRDFRCLAPDMRGHGGTPSPSDHDFSLAALTNDVAALLDHEGIASAVVVGHSYGAVIATSFAVRHPERVRALLSLDQVLDFSGLAGQLAPLGPVIRSAESHMAFRRELLQGQMTEALTGVGRAQVERALEATPVDVACALWAPLFEWNAAELAATTRGLLAALARVPSTIIDSAEIPPYHDAVRALCPDTTLQFLGGGGHYLQHTKTREVAEAIRALAARATAAPDRPA